MIVVWLPAGDIYVGDVDDDYFERLQQCHREFSNQWQVPRSVQETILDIPQRLKKLTSQDIHPVEGHLIVTGTLL